MLSYGFGYRVSMEAPLFKAEELPRIRCRVRCRDSLVYMNEVFRLELHHTVAADLQAGS